MWILIFLSFLDHVHIINILPSDMHMRSFEFIATALFFLVLQTWGDYRYLNLLVAQQVVSFISDNAEYFLYVNADMEKLFWNYSVLSEAKF